MKKLWEWWRLVRIALVSSLVMVLFPVELLRLHRQARGANPGNYPGAGA